MLPDGVGGLYLVSPSQVLHMVHGEQPKPFAKVGSAAGAVALGPAGSLYVGHQAVVLRVAKDGTAETAAEGFGEVYGVAVDSKGVLYVSDWKSGTVVRVAGAKRKVVAKGLKYPSGLVLNADGSLFVKESGRQTNEAMRVRRIAPDGTVTLFAKVPNRSP